MLEASVCVSLVYVFVYACVCVDVFEVMLEPASAAEKWLRARARPSESDRKDKSYTVYCLVLGT